MRKLSFEFGPSCSEPRVEARVTDNCTWDRENEEMGGSNVTEGDHLVSAERGQWLSRQEGGS